MSLRLTKKYLMGRNKLPKFSYILSFLGIVIGVTALLIVSSVMNGLRDDMMRRITDTKAEIKIYHQSMQPIKDYQKIIETVAKHSEVKGVSALVSNELLIHRGESVLAVTNFGINPEQHNRINNLNEKIRVGYINPSEFENDEIIIGLDLSLSLGVTVGEFVNVSSPLKTEPTPFGLLPKSKRFRVGAIFTSGMPEYDKTYTYMSLANGRFFSNYTDEVDLLQVKITNPYNSDRVASQLQRMLDSNYRVEDWSIFDSSLFEAMRLEKLVMLTVLALMLIISGFNMATSSFRMIAEKQVEIGILKALGMSERLISKSFMMVNLIIGMSGIVMGTIISASFIVIQSNYQLVQIPVPGFPMQWLPVIPNIFDFLIVGLLVLGITMLASVIPLQKIKGMEPINVIRSIDVKR